MTHDAVFGNLIQFKSSDTSRELFETLIASDSGFRLERIRSTGQSSPLDDWYDQEEDEWIAVLTGAARLQFADPLPEIGEFLEMRPGDHILIPAHCRHRVDWTAPDVETVWLAIFFSGDSSRAVPE